MFKLNKYTRWYYSIIDNAKNRTNNGYTERHHIIPRSLNGSNIKCNIAILTAREHYICHRLLVKMTEGVERRKMYYALHAITRMSNSNVKVKITSRVFELIRIQHKNNIRLTHQGKIVSAETRKKLSIANTGKTLTDECKEKISKASKLIERGDKWCSKISNGLVAYHATNPLVFTCCYCGLSSKIKGNINRWHNANCKNRPQVGILYQTLGVVE